MAKVFTHTVIKDGTVTLSYDKSAKRMRINVRGPMPSENVTIEIQNVTELILL